MRYLLLVSALFFAVPSVAQENPFATYESGMYDELHPSNKVFYSVYYQSRIKKAFREMEKEEEALLIDTTQASATTDKNGSVYIASPIIHPNSKVREVYIKNDINSDVYVKHN